MRPPEIDYRRSHTRCPVYRRRGTLAAPEAQAGNGGDRPDYRGAAAGVLDCPELIPLYDGDECAHAGRRDVP